MRKGFRERIKSHWHELRYHMEAGLFWYFMGLVSSGMITQTFHYFALHIGIILTVLGDLAAIFVIFICVLLYVKWWKSTSNNSAPDKLVIELDRPIEVIKIPQGTQYLVKNNVCYPIPNKETFEYLGRIFSFTWNDSKLMQPDEIKQKFSIGRELPDHNILKSLNKNFKLFT